MSEATTSNTFVLENLTRRCVVASRIRMAGKSSERRRGLLDATELDADSGLWIDPCEAVHTFGMRMSLDILFLDSRLRLRRMVPGLKPNRIALCLVAKSVVEIRSGQAAASGTQCGDQLELRRSVGPGVRADSNR